MRRCDHFVRTLVYHTDRRHIYTDTPRLGAPAALPQHRARTSGRLLAPVSVHVPVVAAAIARAAVVVVQVDIVEPRCELVLYLSLGQWRLALDKPVLLVRALHKRGLLNRARRVELENQLPSQVHLRLLDVKAHPLHEVGCSLGFLRAG